MNFESLRNAFTTYISPKIKSSAFGPGNESWMLGRVEKTIRYYSFDSPSLWFSIIGAGIILFALSFYSRKRISARFTLVLIFCITVLQLGMYARSWLPSVNPKEFPIYPGNLITRYLQGDSSQARFLVWRDASQDPFILSRNGSDVYRTYDLHGYETLTNRSMIGLYLQNKELDTLDLRLLGLANVKYIISGKKNIETTDLRQVYAADGVRINENLLLKPRAYFAYNSKVVPNISAVTKELLLSNFDGTTALFAKEDSPPELESYLPGISTIHFDKSENEEVVITAQTTTKGIFTLTDTYYPGWKCYVNGKEQPIYCVNYCMRGILLDPGISHIVFKFEPAIFTLGASISGASLFLLLASFVFLRFKQKPHNA